MKSTKPLYLQFKHHMATLVSTAVLACAVAVPSAAYAGSNVSNLPDTAFSKVCFNLTNLVYIWVQIPDETKAVERHDSLMAASDADSTFKQTTEDMFYYGLSKRNIYKGANLKSLMMLQCPIMFRSNSR